MKECNFPLVCGVSEGVCCKFCEKECIYRCDLNPDECDLSEDIKK